MNVGEARDLITHKAKFGDKESIKARDMLRIVHDLEKDEIWITCIICEGSGVAELINNMHLEDEVCNQCDGDGEHVLKVDDWDDEEILEVLRRNYL